MTTSELATGTYEVLRHRLRQAAEDLRERFGKLNEARSAVFGNVETRLLSTTHVTTDHNCIPRGLFANESQLLLGYNVQFGLKTEISPHDVLSAYRFDGQHTRYESLDSLLDPAFVRDFQELYRYYRGATFLRFHQVGPFLYMVFQVGKSASTIKSFKWSIQAGTLHYLDNRSESEVKLPAQHAFAWKRATRESHRQGKHPHISIEDRVFVECVHGDLTIKIEDNTEDGLGIYREPVESSDQTLDDAETHYAILGNLVLLKIRPYQERDYRYLVFSTKQSSVQRLDSIGQCCVLLPDDQGIMFPHGIVLQTGQAKLFDHGLSNLSFETITKSPNGEDFLFLFSQQESGTYFHLRYNLIRQEVDTPLVCHGHAFFANGHMLSMRASDSPQKHHALQVWQTPFTSANFVPTVQSDSMLFKIGNHDLVRGMAECQELLTLIDKDESYADLYADLAKRATDVLDGYFWLDRDEAFSLSVPIQSIRSAATTAIDEFEKVVRVRQETQSQLGKTETETHEVLKSIERSRFEKVEDFVENLSSLRTQRGKAIQLKELRYIPLDKVSHLETNIAEATDRLGVRCVQFLLSPDSLTSYSKQMEALAHQVPLVGATAAAKQLEGQFQQIGASLELLIETVSQLRIDDLAQRTVIVDHVGDCLSQLNRIRSTLKTRMRDLTTRELESDFASQSKLLDQSTANALDTSDSLATIDVALTRVLMQIEELEGRYADSEELLLRLTEKRQTLCDLFESRRQQLVELQTRRANALVAAADRVLAGIVSRSARIDEPAALHAYFAADLMVEKVRKIATQLKELGDSVRSDDVYSRLKAISDDAQRQQRDRRDLQSDGNRLIRLGQHSFSVNQQPIELTTVARNGELLLHITGTQFYQPLQDPALEDTRDIWDQLLPSESHDVYRSEYLAFTLASELKRDPQAWTSIEQGQQVEWVRQKMQTRFSEGYVRGVHDLDASKILAWLCDQERELGLLRFSPRLRGLAWFVWNRIVEDSVREGLETWIQSISVVDRVLPNDQESRELLKTVARQLKQCGSGMLQGCSLQEAAHFVVLEIRAKQLQKTKKLAGVPATQSPQACQLLRAMHEHLPESAWHEMHSAIQAHTDQPWEQWHVAQKAVDAFLEAHSNPSGGHQNVGEPVGEHSDGEHSDGAYQNDRNYVEEMTGLLVLGSNASDVASERLGSQHSMDAVITLTELVGDHARIHQGMMTFDYHEFQHRLSQFTSKVVPRWQKLQSVKRSLLEKADARIKSHEFKARVLTSFVRNQLIDQVYLPRIGENLAKQIGASGENKRSDRMGLLLLISPPGYGKTTLMEYIANRLGLVFVKVNGPALGHAVTSLDPSEASNASAREEVQRINMALEMGDNTMLYLDDIQHCNVQLLQKFIPLCDATRRMEGVWNGVSKTYDLRGRKFAVVMAGNPYTETGDRFQIPDMLANRADVYNLGEIIGNCSEAFEQSYLENCLTSNPVLQPLSGCSHSDQRTMIEAAKRGTWDSLDLESNLSSDSIQDMMSVLQKLHRVRDVVLKMNQAYIRSAAQADEYRTEPVFKLQGSYRNMNRIAEKIVPVMDDAELEQLIISCYQQDAQTLSKDSEANLLKFQELLGTLVGEELDRWNRIKKTFVDNSRLKGLSKDDALAPFLVSFLGMKDGLESIRETIEAAVAKQAVLAAKVAVESSKPAQDPRIIVQHAVPRVMTDLIRSQFQLLYDGLRPVLEEVAKQSLSGNRLRKTVEDLVQRYQAMQEATADAPVLELEEAESQDQLDSNT